MASAALALALLAQASAVAGLSSPTAGPYWSSRSGPVVSTINIAALPAARPPPAVAGGPYAIGSHDSRFYLFTPAPGALSND